MTTLSPPDLGRLATRGLRGHPMRFALSALGIAIGVAAMVAVAGIAQSSKAQLNALLSDLGTNLLRVYPTPDLQGNATRLPSTALPMLRMIGPVTAASSVGELEGIHAYRSPYVPSGNTNSLYVAAVDPTLLSTLHGTLQSGTWFTPASADYPTVVLGNTAAQRLAVEQPGVKLWLGDQWCAVVGILQPTTIAAELDSAVMLPAGAAQTYFHDDGTLTAVYLRADEHQVVPVSGVVPRTASPEHPEYVGIDRPSDALKAQLSADDTLNRLLLGLAAVGLLVGGIGVSNTMIIAVIERRSEIGLRRALGATRSNISIQFMTESMLMAAAGGVAGVILGYLVTAAYAHIQGWATSLPTWVGAAAVLLTVLVGTIAGLYPALKASRQSPTLALAA